MTPRKCPTHPRYQGKRTPKGNCPPCNALWAAKHPSPLDNEIDPIPAGYVHPGSTTWDRGEPDRQKKQEYNRTMGHAAELARRVASKPEVEEIARYLSALAEDENRYVNRRRARSISLSAARDILFLRHFEQIAARVFQRPIIASGYSKKKPTAAIKRVVNLPLSDLHIGATLDPAESPIRFDFLTASRRLARVAVEAADFKHGYRDNTALNLGLNGDIIEGLLLHDIRDGSPLAEQSCAAIDMLADLIAYLAAAYPEVNVYCQTGNHGRNKARHEGRATFQKWDSFETAIYHSLRKLAERLNNVRFSIPKTPVCVIPALGKHILMTHGDTELKLASPSKRADLFEAALNRVNGNHTYGRAHIDVLTVGHFHEPRIMLFKSGSVVVNSALVPPNGHARSEGYETKTGQYIWEGTEKHALGDSRFLEVGPVDDRDRSLDKVIKPYRWRS